MPVTSEKSSSCTSCNSQQPLSSTMFFCCNASFLSTAPSSSWCKKSPDSAGLLTGVFCQLLSTSGIGFPLISLGSPQRRGLRVLRRLYIISWLARHNPRLHVLQFRFPQHISRHLFLKSYKCCCACSLPVVFCFCEIFEFPPALFVILDRSWRDWILYK